MLFVFEFIDGEVECEVKKIHKLISKTSSILSSLSLLRQYC